ncbi:TPA: hypothetical protein ACYLN4_000561 [Burkholderia lata]
MSTNKPGQKRKPRKIKEGSREWKRREREVLETYVPGIVSCSTCGSPRHQKYKCIYCEEE